MYFRYVHTGAVAVRAAAAWRRCRGLPCHSRECCEGHGFLAHLLHPHGPRRCAEPTACEYKLQTYVLLVFLLQASICRVGVDVTGAVCVLVEEGEWNGVRCRGRAISIVMHYRRRLCCVCCGVGLLPSCSSWLWLCRPGVVNGHWQDDGVRDWPAGEPPREQPHGARQARGAPHSHAPIRSARRRRLRRPCTQPRCTRCALSISGVFLEHALDSAVLPSLSS